MISSLIAALIVIWLLAIATSYTMGGWIHWILGLALLVLVLDRIFHRKRA